MFLNDSIIFGTQKKIFETISLDILYTVSISDSLNRVPLHDLLRNEERAIARDTGDEMQSALRASPLNVRIFLNLDITILQLSVIDSSGFSWSEIVKISII